MTCFRRNEAVSLMSWSFFSSMLRFRIEWIVLANLWWWYWSITENSNWDVRKKMKQISKMQCNFTSLILIPSAHNQWANLMSRNNFFKWCKFARNNKHLLHQICPNYYVTTMNYYRLSALKHVNCIA